MQSCLGDKLQQRSLLLLSKICKAHSIIPTSYILQQDRIRVGRVYYYGGSADVSHGEYSGFPVAIKRLKMNEGDSDRIFKVPLIGPARYRCSVFTQRLCQEVIGWKHLSHPNVHPLLGISMSTDPHCFLILSEWMPNGNVMQYTRSNQEANRLRLVRALALPPRFFPSLTSTLKLSNVMSGVVYLHELRIVHGDLKGVSLTFLTPLSPR